MLAAGRHARLARHPRSRPRASTLSSAERPPRRAHEPSPRPPPPRVPVRQPDVGRGARARSRRPAGRWTRPTTPGDGSFARLGRASSSGGEDGIVPVGSSMGGYVALRALAAGARADRRARARRYAGDRRPEGRPRGARQDRRAPPRGRRRGVLARAWPSGSSRPRPRPRSVERARAIALDAGDGAARRRRPRDARPGRLDADLLRGDLRADARRGRRGGRGHPVRRGAWRSPTPSRGPSSRASTARATCPRSSGRRSSRVGCVAFLGEVE